MTETGQRAEIEALYFHGYDYLGKYIAKKIVQVDYIWLNNHDLNRIVHDEYSGVLRLKKLRSVIYLPKNPKTIASKDAISTKVEFLFKSGEV